MIEDSNLFCVRYDTREDGFDAMVLIAEYDLKFSIMSNNDGTGILIVRDGIPNYRLCEMTFQMNYRQVGMLCPVCEKAGVPGCCGHLTFDGKI